MNWTMMQLAVFLAISVGVLALYALIIAIVRKRRRK